MNNGIVKIFVRIIVAILLCLFVIAARLLIGFYLVNHPDTVLSNIWTISSIDFMVVMIITLLIMFILSKGKISDFGFKLTEGMHLKRIIVLGLSVGIITALLEIIIPVEEHPVVSKFSFVQIILFVWIYASISEELLTRGLLQSYLEPLIRYGFNILKLRISFPVLISAIFFALIHLILLFMGMGIYSVLYIVFFAFILGLIAAYYREKTGSLVPAIIVHIFANVGATFTIFFKAN